MAAEYDKKNYASIFCRQTCLQLQGGVRSTVKSFFLYHFFVKRVRLLIVFLFFFILFCLFFIFYALCSSRLLKILKNYTFFLFFFGKKMKFGDDFQCNILRKNKKINNFHVFRGFLSFHVSICNCKSNWLKSKDFVLRLLEQLLFSKSYIFGCFYHSQN